MNLCYNKLSFEPERLLHKILEIISQTLDIDTILNTLAKEIGEYFGIDRAFIIRYAAQENSLHIKLHGSYYRSADVPVFDSSDFPPRLFQLLTRDIPLERAMRLHRFETSEAYYQDLKQRMLDHPHLSETEKTEYVEYFRTILIEKCRTHAFLQIGITYRGIPYGVITLQNCQSRIWTDEDVRLLQDITTYIGVAFYQTDLYQQEQKARKEAEEAREAAVLATRKKSQFLANMSHELRTPLNAIIGYSEMILKGMANTVEKQEKYANAISISGRHLLDMVNDILDISKVEAGKLNLNIEWVALPSLLDALVSITKPMAQEKNVHLRFSVARELEGIQADPQRLKQIFFNLITNAIKFNREGGQVDILIHKTAEGEWIVSQVKDTGIGIPSDKINELFTEFYQVDSSHSRAYDGTGLGLALTKRLVELHGGHISVESEEGIGSTFTFHLPALR